MKWNETRASQCHNGDLVGMVYGDWNIVWEDIFTEVKWPWNDCYASILAEKDGQFRYLKWEWRPDGSGDLWSVTRHVGDIENTLWSVREMSVPFKSVADFMEWKNKRTRG